VTTNTENTDRQPEINAENPYIGPRAFRTGEPLYARDRETRGLANLLVAERVVLLHAPSGAGKTSLIQAGLMPLLKQRRFRPTVPLRVNTPPPPDRPPRNPYLYSVALGLVGDQLDSEELAELPFDAVIEKIARQAGDEIPVLIFDQFEEILTINPTDWENQTTFFRELGRALAPPRAADEGGQGDGTGRLWALFSMREDYIGGLDRYLRYLPGHLRATYRLDFFDRTAAKHAIQLPARDHGVAFTDEAAVELVRRLAVVRVQRPCHGVENVEAPYVQPYQLQVVCRRLWKSVSKERGNGFRVIDVEDVDRHADITRALRSYYAGAVAEVADKTGAAEMAIRDWFGSQIITRERFRTQTVTGPVSGDVDPADVLRALESVYLIRSDIRAGSRWFELAHDMLIEPILDDNKRWARRRLEPWQLAAREWGTDRQVGRLLQGLELRDALRRAHKSDITELERDFIEASDRAEREHGARTQISLLGFIALLELLAIVVLGILLLTR
jgi:hypothetical protein